MVRADACWRTNERIDHSDAIKKNLPSGGGAGQLPAPLRSNDEADGCRSGAEKTARSSTNSSLDRRGAGSRSEEHTSELQSHLNLVCRLLLEKKKKQE